jgi:hypothetical protein
MRFPGSSFLGENGMQTPNFFRSRIAAKTGEIGLCRAN